LASASIFSASLVAAIVYSSSISALAFSSSAIADSADTVSISLSVYSDYSLTSIILTFKSSSRPLTLEDTSAIISKPFSYLSIYY